MELDKRILEGKKPLTCFDIEEAKQYINKRCYFANADAAFSNLDNVARLREGILTGVFEESEYPFCSHGVLFFIESRQIIPCEWVEEKKEPKYRPFTLAEWIDKHGIGDVVHYRSKSEGIELHHMYVGYAYGIGKNINEIGVGTLTLGVASYSFDYLFEDYELFYNGRWLPFGVLDNGEDE